METAQLAALGRAHLWLSFGRDPSYFDGGSTIVRTEGCYAYDSDGRRFLDALGGQGAAMLGYNHPHILAAMRRQMEEQVTNVSTFPPSDVGVVLARRLAELPPAGLSRVFYCHSGSEANETAIKLARQYHRIRGEGGRFKVISRWVGYHGATITAAAVSGMPWRRRAFEPFPAGTVHVDPPQCYHCPYGRSGQGEDLCPICTAADLRRTVEREGPESVSAIIMELTIGGGGCLTPPPAYVQGVRKLCDEYGILLIVDEVLTGFGKTGTWFEVEQYGIVPDLLTVGKALTGGHMPLSAVRIHDRIAGAFDEASQGFDHGFTSAGNPLSCAAALATIDEIATGGYMAAVPGNHRFVMDRLQAIARRHAIVGDVRGRGLLFGVELVADATTRADFADAAAVRRVVKAAQHQTGVLFGGQGLNLFMSPPLVAGTVELEQICDAVADVVEAVGRQFGG